MNTSDIYSAKVGKNINNGRGRWHSQQIDIYMTGEKIGDYVRNYHMFFNTFCPFTIDGRDYALYSRDYTGTRIMTLPDCVDIGGEEPIANGFCPTGYYCPRYHLHEFYVEGIDGISSVRYWSDAELEKEMASLDNSINLVKLTSDLFVPFVFVQGCVWGDDSSNKLQVFDVSKCAEGIIKREEKFGYIELPNNLELPQCIDMTNYCPEDDEPFISISVNNSFTMTYEK